MKQFTIHIPEERIAFFTELFEQLGVAYDRDSIEIPKWQQDIVLKRIASTKTDSYKNWDGIEDELSL